MPNPAFERDAQTSAFVYPLFTGARAPQLFRWAPGAARSVGKEQLAYAAHALAPNCLGHPGYSLGGGIDCGTALQVLHLVRPW